MPSGSRGAPRPWAGEGSSTSSLSEINAANAASAEGCCSLPGMIPLMDRLDLVWLSPHQLQPPAGSNALHHPTRTPVALGIALVLTAADGGVHVAAARRRRDGPFMEPAVGVQKIFK